MKKNIYLIILISLFLSGCLVENVRKLYINQINDPSPKKIKSEEQTLLFKLNYFDEVRTGMTVEVQSYGEDCVPFMKYVFDPAHGEAQSNHTTYINWITSELKKHGVNTTNVNVSNTLKVIGVEYKANTCYINPPDTSQGKGEAYVNLRWVLKIENGKEIYSRATEGYGNIPQFTSDARKAMEDAYKMATRKLLDDADFISILTFNNSQQESEPPMRTLKVKTYHTDSVYERFDINQKKSKVLGKNRPDWAKGVFTLITEKGHGSGFAISENLILTNNHVISEEKNVIVKMAQDDGSFKAWDGEVIRNSKKRDVALIKIRGELKEYFSVNNDIKQGDDIFVMGSPIDVSHESTLTKGIISHPKRTRDGLSYIQSDANVYGGNSGGPMINFEGNVIGISVLGNREAEGLNLFIPIKDALDYLNIKIAN